MNMQRFSKFMLLILVVLGLSISQVSANTSRVTRGDVEATLEAFTTGGRVILSHGAGGVFSPAPATLFDGSIRPFPGSPWDGGRFCVDDWHVLLIADFEGGDQSFTREEAESILSSVSTEFTLDGESLSTERTAIKRLLEPESFGFDEAYAFQEGVIMSPDELGVGEHFFVVQVDLPDGILEFPINFFIDPSDSETCTGL